MAAFERLVTETGMSETHRAEAGRLAMVIHGEIDRQGGNLVATDSIALARLHADLAIADELRLIRQHLDGHR